MLAKAATHSHARNKNSTTTMAVSDAAPEQRGEELCDVEDRDKVAWRQIAMLASV